MTTTIMHNSQEATTGCLYVSTWSSTTIGHKDHIHIYLNPPILHYFNYFSLLAKGTTNQPLELISGLERDLCPLHFFGDGNEKDKEFAFQALKEWTWWTIGGSFLYWRHVVFPMFFSPVAHPPRWTCQPMVPDYRTHSQLEHGWTVLSILNPMFGKQSLLNQPKAQCF